MFEHFLKETATESVVANRDLDKMQHRLSKVNEGNVTDSFSLIRDF